MMKIVKLIFVFAFLYLFKLNLHAQVFLKKEKNKNHTLKEMQLQFEEWKKNTNLIHTKHWKYFKRWENEMQFHTNAKGEPADPSIFISEAIKVADEKNKSQSKNFLTSSWSPVGPYNLPGNETGYMQNGMGRINCIAFHPTDPNTYFVGVAQGGLWKTTNNGISWTPLTDNLPIERISDIALDPNDVNSIYISVCDFEYIDWNLYGAGKKRNTHTGLGVYKTTDGGLTWFPTGLSFQLSQGDASLIRKVLVNPANSNNLVACGVSGMYTSMDAGVTWAHPMDSLFWDMVQDPVNPNILYASTGWLYYANIGRAGIYKSTNFGLTWILLPTGIPPTGAVQRVKLAIAHSDPNYIYAMCVNDQEGSYGIYKSTNAGASWTFIDPGVNILEGGDGSNIGGQGTYDLGFTVNRTNKNAVYVGGVNIWGSIDGANSFNPVCHWTLYYGPTIHGDIHFIETQPTTGNIFVCSDGGLYKTTSIIPETWSDANIGIPWPTNWTTVNNGMNITSFYRISSSKNATGRLLAGAQDNGSMYYDGSAWFTVYGGDGMDNFLDPLNDSMLICSSQYGNFGYSFDNGINFTGNFNILGEAAEWTSPLIADYNNSGVMYAGFTNVVKSTDNGNSWNPLTPLPSSGGFDNELCALAVANSNSNVIYAVRRIRYEFGVPSSAYVTLNGGTTWTNITAGLPDSLYMTSVDVSQTDANTAYITVAQFSGGVKVFKTNNAGSTWQNISFNLPNIPVNCVKTVPTTGQVMIATDLGIYILNSATSTWSSYSTGLPNVILSDIEFNTVLDKIYVASFGRGIWETDLSSLSSGVEDVSKNTSVELFPSPNNGTFSIKLNDKNSANEVLHLDVIDIMGRLVYSTNLEGQTVYHQNLNLNSGMYFAKIKGKKINGVKSFVIK